MSERAEPSAPVDTAGAEVRPLLTVVVPVFNQEAAIADNVETIRSSLEAGLGDDFELIVVSDGSIDRTAERVARAARRATSASSTTTATSARATRSRSARSRLAAATSGTSTPTSTSTRRGCPSSWRRAQERRSTSRSARSATPTPSPLPALAPRRQLALPAARAHPLPARRPRHPGRAEGLPARGRGAGAAAAPRQAVRVRPRAAGGVAGARLLADRGAADPARLPLHRLGRALARGAARARRHRRDLLPAADPALLPARRGARGGVRLDAAARATARSCPSWRPTTTVAARARLPELEVLVARRSSTPAAVRAAVERAQRRGRRVPRPGERPAGNWLAATVPFLGRGEIAAVVAPTMAPARADRRGAAQRRRWPNPGSAAARSTFASRPETSATSPTSRPRRSSSRRSGTRRSTATSRSTSSSRADRGGRPGPLHAGDRQSCRARRRSSGPHLRTTSSYGRRRARDLRRRGLRALRPTTLAPARARRVPRCRPVRAARRWPARDRLAGRRGRSTSPRSR